MNIDMCREKVDDVMTKVMVNFRKSVQRGELAAAHAMAVRILVMMNNVQTNMSINDTVLSAHVALFIALKTECIATPMPHQSLERLTGLSWASLQAIEAKMLCDVGWKLYDGALEP